MSNEIERHYDSLRFGIPEIVWDYDSAKQNFGHQDFVEMRLNDMLGRPFGNVLQLSISFDQGVVIKDSKTATVSRATYSKKDHDIWVNVAMGRQMYDLPPQEFKVHLADLLRKAFALMETKLRKLGCLALAASFEQAANAALAEYETEGYLLPDAQMKEMYIASLGPLPDPSEQESDTQSTFSIFLGCPLQKLRRRACRAISNTFLRQLKAVTENPSRLSGNRASRPLIISWSNCFHLLPQSMEAISTDMTHVKGGCVDLKLRTD